MALTTITALAFQDANLYESTVAINDKWQRETLVSPFDFAIYKSEDSLQAERNRIHFTTEPIFIASPDAPSRMQDNRDVLLGQLDDIFDAFKDYRLNDRRGRMAATGDDSTASTDFSSRALEDSLRYIELRQNARVKLSGAQWRWLGEDFARRSPDLPDTTREMPPGPPYYETVLDEVFALSARLNVPGILDIPLDSVFTEEIIVRDTVAHTFEPRQRDHLVGLNEVYVLVEGELEQMFEGEAELSSIPTRFVQAILAPRLQFQRGDTVQRWQDAQSKISLTRGMVSEGEDIVHDGEVVTPDIKQKLISLQLKRIGNVGPQLHQKRTIGKVLLALSTFAIFFLYLFMARRKIFDDNLKILLIAILYAGIIGLFALAVRLNPDFMYAVPIVIVSVLLTVIFDSRVGIFGTLALALIGGLILGFDFKFTFATLLGGTLGAFSVRDVRNRGQFFISAAVAFGGYLIGISASWLFLESSTTQLGSDLLMAGISSILLTMAYPLLWVFERGFDVTTDLRLLELSDTNRPLLKEFGQRAPGSFNHTLQVANLAEAAADAIGANALLTRVGALYHDIGKMTKPQYFVENQRAGANAHDKLKPHMSALIIASHVKDGLDLGQQHRLPGRVLEFIPMHHGTTRIEYFYQKALADHTEGEGPVLDGDFRYPGPRPETKETGILMLADGIEAASRSLSDPSRKHLEGLIDTMIKARIDDGQLDDTQLTFRDLKQIRQTFLAQLSGVYHLRIKYPEQKAN